MSGTVINAKPKEYNLIISYYVKHVLQFFVVAIGISAMIGELQGKPFTFDKTFFCYIDFDHTWSLSSVQCDYTSVALSPIFLAIYLTISACISLASFLALCSIHKRNNMRCLQCIFIDNDNFMRLIAVGDTAERAYNAVQELKLLA